MQVFGAIPQNYLRPLRGSGWHLDEGNNSKIPTTDDDYPRLNKKGKGHTNTTTVIIDDATT